MTSLERFDGLNANLEGEVHVDNVGLRIHVADDTSGGSWSVLIDWLKANNGGSAIKRLFTELDADESGAVGIREVSIHDYPHPSPPPPSRYFSKARKTHLFATTESSTLDRM